MQHCVMFGNKCYWNLFLKYGFINVPLDSRLDALNAVWRHPKAVSCPNVADDWCQHDGSIHTAGISGVALPGGIQLGIIRRASW